MQTDELLRFAFAQGSGKSIVANAVVPDGPVPTTAEQPPPGLTDAAIPLPHGVTDLLADAPFPHGRPSADADHAVRWRQMLVAGFGVQRREPSHIFNDHRGYPSVRSKFPVHVYTSSDGGPAWVDPYRHALIPVHGADPGPGTGVVLAARYTHLPHYYERLRGPLVDLELGVNLRVLAVAMQLFGYRGVLRLPDGSALSTLDRLGLRPDGEWALPLTVSLSGAPAGPGSDRPPQLPDVDARQREILSVVVAANRETLTGTAEPAELGPGIPPHASTPGPSWATVFFERSSGRVPPHVNGMLSRRRTVPSAAASDLAAWLAVPPPHPLLRRVFQHLTCTVVMQDVIGYETGAYRLCDGALQLVRADRDVLRQVQDAYGVGIAVDFDSGIRDAAFAVNLSVDLPALLAEFGTAAWTYAQYCAGWLAHGGGLAATAHGLYARPTRAFDDIDAQSVLELPPGRITVLSLLCGTTRYTEPVLDMRV